jgi:hypothetical protein
VLEGVDLALAAAARRVDHEGRRVEAGRQPADLLLELDRRADGRAQILDPLHEVVHVHVVRVHFR